MLQVFERIRRHVQSLEVRGSTQFTATTVRVSYIIGERRDNAANDRAYGPRADRADFLETVAAEWKALDAEERPCTRTLRTTCASTTTAPNSSPASISSRLDRGFA